AREPVRIGDGGGFFACRFDCLLYLCGCLCTRILVENLVAERCGDIPTAALPHLLVERGFLRSGGFCRGLGGDGRIDRWRRVAARAGRERDGECGGQNR